METITELKKPRSEKPKVESKVVKEKKERSPEQIVKDLHTAGYKIKKRKNFKQIAQQVDPRRIIPGKLKSQHELDNEIYL
jgi:hypothetical protein